MQARGPVADQHEVPAAALRAPHEVQEERSTLQAGGALGREHRLGPVPVPVPVPEPLAPPLTRSGYSVPTQPPHISHRPHPQMSRELRRGAGLRYGAGTRAPGVGGVWN